MQGLPLLGQLRGRHFLAAALLVELLFLATHFRARPFEAGPQRGQGRLLPLDSGAALGKVGGQGGMSFPVGCQLVRLLGNVLAPFIELKHLLFEVGTVALELREPRLEVASLLLEGGGPFVQRSLETVQTHEIGLVFTQPRLQVPPLRGQFFLPRLEVRVLSRQFRT